MAEPSRKPINMKVSSDSHRRLMDFCAAHGITLTAFTEALSSYLAGTDVDRPPRWLLEVIKEARRIGAERLRR